MTVEVLAGGSKAEECKGESGEAELKSMMI